MNLTVHQKKKIHTEDAIKLEQEIVGGHQTSWKYTKFDLLSSQPCFGKERLIQMTFCSLFNLNYSMTLKAENKNASFTVWLTKQTSVSVILCCVTLRSNNSRQFSQHHQF